MHLDIDIFASFMVANVLIGALWKLVMYLIKGELAHFEVRMDEKFVLRDSQLNNARRE